QTTAFTIGNFLNEQGKAVLTNANGDIFVVLDIGSIVKYLPDGRLDSSYGNAGYSNGVKIGIASAVFQGYKIVVAGSNNGNFAITGNIADGSLDTSNGKNRNVITNFNNYYDQVNAIALQGDKIIAAGSSNGDFALARYTADGSLDSSFGENGKVTTDFNN